MKIAFFLGMLPLALAGLGCQSKQGGRARESAEEGTPLKGQSASDLKQPIARIDDKVITVGEFQHKINQQSPYIRARYTSNERKKEFLDSLVKFEVLAREAQTKGYDRDAEVIRTMKQVMIQKLMKEEFENRVKLEDIPEAECKKYYDEHPAEFNRPEEVRVSAIFTKDKKKAEEVAKQLAAKAKPVPGKSHKVIDPMEFRNLVTRYTEDAATKDLGGDLSYLTADSPRQPAPVVQAAFALPEVGTFTAEPVQAGERWVLLTQTGRNRALQRNFEEVKRQIQSRLYRDKRMKAMEDYIEELKRKAKVDVDEAKLGKVMVDTSEAGGPGPLGMPPHGGLVGGVGHKP